VSKNHPNKLKVGGKIKQYCHSNGQAHNTLWTTLPIIGTSSSA